MSNVICFASERRRRLHARELQGKGLRDLTGAVKALGELRLDLCTLDGQLAAVEADQSHYRGIVATSDRLSRAHISALLELVALQLRHQALSARRRRLERKVFSR